MGVPPSHTSDYRDKNDILGGEGIEIIEEEKKVDQKVKQGGTGPLFCDPR
jgi:hypothetical protein